MPTVELSDRFVASAKPGKGARQTEFFDTLTKGLCLSCSSGGAKTFYLAFTRPADGKRARLRLGPYPEVSLATAREKARQGRATVVDGGDPVAAKKAARDGQTVADLVDNYIARHATSLRSGAAIARRLRKNVSDVIGDVRLGELHRRDITRCIDAVVDRGAGVEANRVFEDLRAMLRWARGRGDVDQNLVDGMKRPTETAPRERVLDAGEIATMWKGLAGASMRESTRRILRLCLITAQRVGEVAGMHRDELNLDHGLWIIPATRTKNATAHVVPLTEMALAVIRQQLDEADALARRKGRDTSPFVFPGPGARAATTGHAIAKAVKREEVPSKQGAAQTQIMGIAPWTPHDLRRTAATHMEELGVSPFVIGHALNHASITKATITSRVYARYTYDKEKREALELWADHLSGIVEGRASNILALAGAA